MCRRDAPNEPVDDAARVFALYIRFMGSMPRREKREAEERAKLAARPHQVLMRFQRFGNHWQVRFTPTGSDWVIRVCSFADDEKIRSMWRRFAARRMAEDVAIFEYAIQHGTGAVELRLADEQMAALKQPKPHRL